MSEQPQRDALVEQAWRTYLTTGEFPDFMWRFGYQFQDFRRVMTMLPTGPRCSVCGAPFHGIGSRLVRLVLGRNRSKLNPKLCNGCEQFAIKYQGGAEVELSMLFADVRGSTGLAEKTSAGEFSHLINRFYKATTEVLIHSNALIEKMIGDEVAGLYVPGFAGPGHARVAVDAARQMLRATGHADPGGPWIPVGVGVHTGTAFVGAVGSEEGVADITALGDAVNTAARLAAQAGPGEAIVSEEACAAAGLDPGGVEKRRLQLKGRSEPVDVRVIRVAPGSA